MQGLCRRVGLIGALVFLVLASVVRGELKLLDKPLYIFPGQQFRIAIEQPAGAGALAVDVPETLEMFDTWPKDTIQRFYFKALKPGDATLSFKGKGGIVKVPLQVMPWTEAFTPRKLEKFELPRIWPVGETDYKGTKKRRTFYSEDELKAKREAKGKPNPMAREWLEMSDEEVWNIIPGPCVPRTCLMVLGGGKREDGRGKGCPVCGMKVYEGRSAFYPWIFDAKKHPWKVGCPSCGTWFPSNDWHKGDMHSGAFPDDGYGCEPVKPIASPSGTPWRWPFIAYYHQWQAYMRTLTPGIERCGDAFARTGDRRYAHKAAVGLFRYAESMLDMAVNLKHRKMACRDAILRWPVGATVLRNRLAGTFLYIQPNWDTRRMEHMAQVWDLIFDQIEGDEELLAFCRRRHHPEIETMEDLRQFVEAGVIRVPLQAALDNAVARNYPMQEVMIATMALIMDSPRALDLADWLINDGAGMRFALTNQFFKDGSAHESEGYNHIQIRDLERIFDVLERIRQLYPEEWQKRGLVSLYDDPKYRLMYDFPIDNGLIGRTTTWTGDTGRGGPAISRKPMQAYPCQTAEFVNVYKRTRDPRFAQAMYGPKQTVPAELAEPELRAEVERIGKEQGWQVKLKSSILDGYGHAILRSGSGEDRRALWLRYGRVVQHLHYDMLSIGLAGMKRDLLPELGYPRGWTYSGHWAKNWGTHYGTHIVGVRSNDFMRGYVTLFADTPPAQVVTAASALLSKPQRPRRWRTNVLVDVSATEFYVVTLERVLGGEEHVLSFHGPDSEATPFGVELTKQKGGTVAGPEVAYRDYASMKEKDKELTCLAFMYDVQRGRPNGIWGMDCLLRDQGNAHLRASMATPEGCDVAFAKGKPAQGKKSYEMPWVIVRRKMDAEPGAQYLTVVEPYEGDRVIEKIECVPVSAKAEGAFKPMALRVTGKGFVDTLLFQCAPPCKCTIAGGLVCDGEFGFWRERDGKLAGAVLAGGTVLRKGEASVALPSAGYAGRVKSCDWAKRSIVIEPAPEDAAALAGRHIRLSNEAGSNASYLVESAEAVEGGCRVVLPLDPRVGEGFVKECTDGVVVSGSKLRLASWRYYSGKTLANEDRSVLYRLGDVSKMSLCRIDESQHGKVSAEELGRQFVDKNGDGRACFAIYDYGPGDWVTIKNSTGVRDTAYGP